MIVDDNPWFQGKSQTNRYRALCSIIVNGVPVTDNLDPFLISLHVYDGAPQTAEIELDDRDGRLPIPPLQGSLQIGIGWASESMIRVFTGLINDVEHGFDRKRGGRRMWIHGEGAPMASAIKSPFDDHKGDGAEPGQQQGTPIPLAAFAGQVAGNAGAGSAVGPSLAGTVSDYWSMNNESAMQWHSRMAKEQGAVMRIEGNVFVLGRPQDFKKPTVMAVWGDNLISWRVHPQLSRTVWGGSMQTFFDTQKALWNIVGGGGAGSGTSRLPFPAPNSQAAQQQVAGAQSEQQNDVGYGHIVINGEPNAQWMGHVTLVGARPGVDGTYLIHAAEHMYSRQGYITQLEVATQTEFSIGDIAAAVRGVQPVAPAQPAPGQFQNINPFTAPGPASALPASTLNPFVVNPLP